MKCGVVIFFLSTCFPSLFSWISIPGLIVMFTVFSEPFSETSSSKASLRYCLRLLVHKFLNSWEESICDIFGTSGDRVILQRTAVCCHGWRGPGKPCHQLLPWTMFTLVLLTQPVRTKINSFIYSDINPKSGFSFGRQTPVSCSRLWATAIWKHNRKEWEKHWHNNTDPMLNTANQGTSLWQPEEKSSNEAVSCPNSVLGWEMNFSGIGKFLQ